MLDPSEKAPRPEPHPAVERALGALNNYLASFNEQNRLNRVLHAAVDQIPVDQMDAYFAAAQEAGERHRAARR